MVYYFGTQLNSAGHFFFKLEGESMRHTDIYFKHLPFDPENLTKEYLPKGAVTFYSIEGWTIMRVEGSCADNRGATKSVFFINEIISNEEMQARVLATPIAIKIIDKMPFEVMLK